jgi:hypothetical protein
MPPEVGVSSGDQLTPAPSVGIVPMTTDRLDSAGQVFASSHVDAAVDDGQVLGIAVWLPPGHFAWSPRASCG